jgi:hypothetical protein
MEFISKCKYEEFFGLIESERDFSGYGEWEIPNGRVYFKEDGKDRWLISDEKPPDVGTIEIGRSPIYNYRGGGEDNLEDYRRDYYRAYGIVTETNYGQSRPKPIKTRETAILKAFNFPGGGIKVTLKDHNNPDRPPEQWEIEFMRILKAKLIPSTGGEKPRGGAPRYPENDWAKEQIKEGKSKKEIFYQWIQKRKEAGRKELDDAWDVFCKAIK